MDYTELLRSKGFELNTYPEGRFWELVVETDEDKKREICKIFNAVIDDYIGFTDIETVVLQVNETFKHCVFCYDCNDWDVGTQEFMDCIAKL